MIRNYIRLKNVVSSFNQMGILLAVAEMILVLE